jgi:uncharacterized protein (TIGR03084 family)
MRSVSEAADVFDALEDEQAQLEAMLAGLDELDWQRSSACEGWSVVNVVLHLAQTEEAVCSVVEERDTYEFPVLQATSVADMMEQWVRSETDVTPEKAFGRWKTARSSALEALRAADPGRAVQWAAAPLKPKTLATTRLSEHWIHALDVAVPLGIDYPDTGRLWHVARLAYKTLPYAFSAAGREEPPAVRFVLTSPSGEAWTFGPDQADCVIRGPAGELCRVAARRLAARDASALRPSGERSGEVLELIRTFAV